MFVFEMFFGKSAINFPYLLAYLFRDCHCHSVVNNKGKTGGAVGDAAAWRSVDVSLFQLPHKLFQLPNLSRSVPQKTTTAPKH